MPNINCDHCHTFMVGDRVKILTKAPSCYDSKTGIVTEKVGWNLQPDPNAVVPYFYRIMLDAPVDIGEGRMSQSDIHPCEEVFPENTSLGNYWGIISRK